MNLFLLLYNSVERFCTAEKQVQIFNPIELLQKQVLIQTKIDEFSESVKSVKAA
ncbi:hypothetical protein JYQ62_19385 [Nostoc sp. UHCC 0702]|nr:hypothetical protein JYQ62_19385 [Nostoc sp. UHCC 0702]